MDDFKVGLHLYRRFRFRSADQREALMAKLRQHTLLHPAQQPLDPPDEDNVLYRSSRFPWHSDK